MKKRIDAYYAQVSDCRLCHRESGIMVPLPDRTPGRGGVSVLVVGEQPDREIALGTGRTGLMNPGPEMERMRAYLENVGVDPEDVFYTTCVQCLPRDPQARPGRPTLGEAKNCTRHLQKLIELLRPRVIVPLGHTAVQAIQWVFRDWTELRQFILNYDVGKAMEKNGTIVYPLYHTSSSTVKARSEDRQSRDWSRIPALLDAQERREAPTG